MALIKCSECGKEISNKADACPTCGNPIHKPAIEGEEKEKIVTIEQTSKKWKKQGCLSAVLYVFGIIILGKSIPLGITIIVIALCFSFYARIGAWWTNG